MDKKTIIIILVLFAVFTAGLLIFGRTMKEEPQPAQIAENWIKESAPTYVYDGFDLELVSEETIRPDEAYKFVFSFSSRAAGYGDRTGEMVAQVITPHTIEVIVENGQVTSAVTDGVYDEIRREMIEEDNDVTEPETMSVSIYFVRVDEDQEEIVAVERTIPFTLAVGRAALNELLAGPLPFEADQGLTTAINEGTVLNSLEIENGVAYADFDERLGEGVAGSARVMAIRGQIERTLEQFPTVDEVVISIDGETEEILQP